MPNYLERVAMSAAATTARARPPATAPPLAVAPVVPLEVEEQVIVPAASSYHVAPPIPPVALPIPEPGPMSSAPIPPPPQVTARQPGVETPRPPAPSVPEPVVRDEPEQGPPQSEPAAPSVPEPVRQVAVVPESQPEPQAKGTAPPTGTFTFPAFAPGITVRVPKTLRPSESSTALPPSLPEPPPRTLPAATLSRSVAGHAAVAREPASAERTVSVAPAAPKPPARAQHEAPIPEPPSIAQSLQAPPPPPVAPPPAVSIHAPSAPRPPAPPKPAIAASAPATIERRPRLQIGHLDLQVINTPPPAPAVPARTAPTTASYFLEAHFLERSRFRL